MTQATTEYLTHGQKLIRFCGSESAIERMNAGVLPEEDFDDELRAILFAPVAGYKKWQKLIPAHVRELAELRGHDVGGLRDADVKFETLEADVLSTGEWNLLKALRTCMPEALVSAYWVVASCSNFEQRFTKARVVVDFHGRSFIREIAL